MNGYDDEFYRRYEDYLVEPSVRAAHDWVLSIVMLNPAFQSVVDLGCGRAREFQRFAKPATYIGIDLCEGADIRDNYRTLESVAPSTAFVSLFSSEITAPYEDNYRFYRRLLSYPFTQAGLVSGFFYAGTTSSIIDEVNGIRSYQTRETTEQCWCREFSEKRIILPVPSAMFGSNVYEVWKIFERR